MTSCTNHLEASSGQTVINTGNDILILHEIRHALKNLLDTGQPTTIDLRAIPMAPGEEDRIEASLGKGEISVTLDALGPSTIQETEIAGVWLITHFNVEEEILGKFIEITNIPSLIESPIEDMKIGLELLINKLSD